MEGWIEVIEALIILGTIILVYRNQRRIDKLEKGLEKLELTGEYKNKVYNS